MDSETYTLYKNRKNIPVKIQIEFNRELIEKLIKDKVPLKHIHEHLIELDKIKCSYRSFIIYMKQFRTNNLIPETKTVKPFVPPEKKEKKFVNTNGLTTNIDDLA